MALKHPSKLVYLDIETVPEKEKFTQLSDKKQEIFIEKYFEKKGKKKGYEDVNNYFKDTAGLIAEFGKIVTISIGRLKNNKYMNQSFYGTDEKRILRGFKQKIKGKNIPFCGHNIKQFDAPFLSKRFLNNGIGLPKKFQLYGLPPREVDMVDTMELRKQSGWNNTGLETIATCLGIKTPKIVDKNGNKVDGSYVSKMYYGEKRYKGIAKYCERDIKCTYEVYAKIFDLMD